MRPIAITVSLLFVLAVAGCGGGGSEDAEKAAAAKGPIKVWYSNNKEEVAWGKAAVAKWNKANPKETVTGQEIPAGKTSEEVIGASITAGNAPCLIFNTTPAAVPQFQKQGGLVPLDSLPGGNVGSGQQFNLGVICSFSIPIITIVALILLMVIVSLLNFVFGWLPYLRICFPMLLKGK